MRFYGMVALRSDGSRSAIDIDIGTAQRKVEGRAASLAQNIELNALTSKLNELANKAGFSGRLGEANGSLLGHGSGTGGQGVEENTGLGLQMDAAAGTSAAAGRVGGGAATSTSIERGTTAYSSLTDRDATHGGASGSKAKDW